MQKDLKIGILIGFFFATAATLTISMWPTESLDERQKAAFTKQVSGADTTPAPTLNQTSPPSEERSQENTLKFGLNDKHPAVTNDDLFSYLESRPPTAWPQKNEPRIHTVVAGDTLTSIARQFYEDPAKWTKIRDANKSVIKNPNSLTPGTKLVIPKD